MKNYKNVIKRTYFNLFNYEHGNSSDFVKQPA